jgi:hypothetical protein
MSKNKQMISMNVMISGDRKVLYVAMDDVTLRDVVQLEAYLVRTFGEKKHA